MKTFERIIIKAALVQLVMLLLTQVFYHSFNAFPELKVITQYEGVTDNNFTEILETIGNK